MNHEIKKEELAGTNDLVRNSDYLTFFYSHKISHL